MQIYEMNTKDIKKLHYKGIMFFMLAEGGAMGEPGAVNIICNSKHGVQVLHANYCYGDFDMDKLAEIFTPLQTFDCGIFGDVAGVAPGWHHVYLGAGNHLLVRDSVFDQFMSLVDGKSEPEIYQSYMEIALKLLVEGVHEQ